MIEQCEKCKHKEILYGGIVGCIFMDADCKKGEKYDPYTNADHIRSMSDEELSVLVRAIIMAEDCPATGCDCDKCFFKEACFNGSKWYGKEMEWLKQPAEEE